MFDLIVRGGSVLDGAGNPAFRADVAVDGGRIAALGQLGQAEARAVLDVTGLTICPGFIDVHSHSDALPFWDEPLPAKILQGVTTEITGNCGSTPFPCDPSTVDLLRSYHAATFSALPYDWTRLAGYMDRLEEVGPVSNVAPLVGHNTVRVAVMGYDDRAPTADELLAMQRLVGEALEDGAVGLSTGLIYTPGVYSTTDEVVALAEVLRGSGRPYATHPRGETHNLFNAIDEAITIGERTGVPVQISHLKAAGRPNFGRGQEVIDRITAARERGLNVTGDVYPYDAGSGKVASLMPPWALEGGTPSLLERLADPTSRARIAREIETGIPGWVNLVEASGWDNLWITNIERNRTYLGWSIAEIADEHGVEPADALMTLIQEEEARANVRLKMMDEPDVRLFLSHPLVMIGSDAAIVRGRPHPRTWGTYPRVLGYYAREVGLFSQAEAVRKMTSYPAQRFGLYDRGLVRPGMWADLVVFDAATVLDRATPDDPEQAPAGMPHVFVNGRFAVRDSVYTGARAGRALRA